MSKKTSFNFSPSNKLSPKVIKSPQRYVREQEMQTNLGLRWKPIFWTVVLEKTLQSPLDCKVIQPVYPKGNQSWILKDWCWSWSSNTLVTWCEELTHLKIPWCWERLKAGGEGDNRGWDGWMASPTEWTWVWVSSGSWWWTGKPVVLRSMGSQRVRHDWATKLNWRWQLEERFLFSKLGSANYHLWGKWCFGLVSYKVLLEHFHAHSFTYCPTAPHSSTLAWKIPWMKEPGRRQYMGSLRVGQLRFAFSLSCIGEGNDNPLQCSCQGNPRDGGAWWAAVYGVAQSRTWLKRLSSRSSNWGWCPWTSTN